MKWRNVDHRFSIRVARDIFKTTFEKDTDFRRAYKDNIAMLLHDRYGLTDHKTRNQAADDIMKILFDAKAPDKKKTTAHLKSGSRFDILDI